MMTHTSWQAYLNYKEPNRRTLKVFEVKEHLGGYLMKAHDGRKPTRKWFATVGEIREWLRDNTSYK